MTTHSTARATLLILLASIAVVACQHRPAPTPTVAPSEFPPEFPARFYASQPADTVYRVDPARSKLLVKVYRAGPLAALGHNHVVTSAATDGYVYLPADIANARADLFVPVDRFVVDDADARAAAGPDFTTQPTAADIAGTREHMLGASLLDATQYPFVRIHVTPLHVGEASARVTLALDVRGKTTTLPVDVEWHRSGREIAIAAHFSVDHAALGLEPYSALGGALRVGDPIDFQVTLVALQRDR